MKNERDVKLLPAIEQTISDLHQQQEVTKTDQLVSLITEIIVSTTLNEYYETSDKIP